MATPDASQPTTTVATTSTTSGADDLDLDHHPTVNVVQTPTSPSSAFALSRFEFETGTKGNEGTKILMVEWDAAAAAAAAANKGGEKKETKEEERVGGHDNKKDGSKKEEAAAAAANVDDWEVTWDGKEALLVLPVRDTDAPPTTCRLYFLLPPKAPIPTLVTISPRTSSSSSPSSKTPVAAGAPSETTPQQPLHAKPLPAIFPAGLPGQRPNLLLAEGTRGVLHTRWARTRLARLLAEIAAEMRENGESVGLEMALQERQWIVDHFGLRGEDDTDDTPSLSSPTTARVGSGGGATSPSSPRSPVGGRLGDKLKGLKLATSPAELAAAKEGMLYTLSHLISLSSKWANFVSLPPRSRKIIHHSPPPSRRRPRPRRNGHRRRRRHGLAERRHPTTTTTRRRQPSSSTSNPRHRGRPLCAAHEPSQPGNGHESL